MKTRTNHYILDGKKPVPVKDLLEWAKLHNPRNNIVKQTKLPDDVRISTVFLGIDHAFMGGPPILFETMIFGGEHDQYQRRYSTWEEAEQGHQETIEMIFEVNA